MSVINPKTRLGYEEYCLFPNDGRRHEVINGLHYMNPAPTPKHQAVSRWLQHLMFTQIELTGLGKVINAPIDVQLGDHDIVQPDLIVILNESRAVTTDTRVVGPPNLVVEILSSSTSKNDLTLKWKLYEQSGVDEYWIVDPDECRVDQLVAEDGRFIQRDSSTTELTMAILPRVAITVREIWNR